MKQHDPDIKATYKVNGTEERTQSKPMYRSQLIFNEGVKKEGWGREDKKV